MRHYSNRKLKLTLESIKDCSDLQKEYIHNYINMTKRIRMYQIVILLVSLILWEVCTYIGWLDAFIFSSPSRMFHTLITMIWEGKLISHILVTLLETFLSFFFVNVIGVALAILLWWNQKIAKIVEPYLVVLNSLPKSALAPVFIVWLGNNMKTIIVAAVSVAVFGTVITLYTNFKNVEEDKVKLIRTLGGTKKDVLIKVVLPSNVPEILSLMKVNIGLSLVGVIIGEFLAAKAGLGYLIIYGSQVFKLDIVLLSIVILCIVATALYKLITILEQRFSYK